MDPMINRHSQGVVAGALATAAVGSVHAAPVVFFDRDLHSSNTQRLAAFPNSQAQRDAFVGNLVTFYEEDLESIASNTFNPTLNFDGEIQATIDGGVIRTVAPGATDNHGRYPVSGVNYLNLGNAAATGIMQIQFSEPIAAFGFYGIDIGDFDGTLRMTQYDGSMQTFIVDPIGNDGTMSGSMLFWGMIDIANPFTAIEFYNNTGVFDVFSFDNFIVARAGEIVPLPLGAGLGLVGLLAVGGVRTRRID